MNSKVGTFMESKRAELQHIKHVAVCSCSHVNFVPRYAIIADPGTRAVKGVDLRPLACWDCGFDTRRGHGWLSVVSVVCCQV
jgi:hypothetical protein